MMPLSLTPQTQQPLISEEGGGSGFQYLESLGKIVEVSLPIAPMPSRPHFSVAQEVLNGKSARHHAETLFYLACANEMK